MDNTMLMVANTEFESWLNLLKASEKKTETKKVRAPNLKASVFPDSKFFWGGWDVSGARRKYFNLSFDILRRIEKQVVIVAAIHNLRCSQIREYTLPSDDEEKPGWKIKIKDQKKHPDENELKAIKQITEWFQYCGFRSVLPDDALGERDRLSDAMERLTREILCIDQVAIELRRDNAGQILDWYVLDAATIYPVDRRLGYKGDKSVHFVQMLDYRPVAEFGEGDILWDCMNKRADIRARGFGYSPLEQAIDTVTAFLFAVAYNRDQFNLGTLPRGFFSFDPKVGQLDQETLEELQRKWTAMFSGIKGMWKTPFLQHGAKWNPVSPNNRDMEYDKYLQALQSWICCVYKIDPAELGLKFDRSASISIGEGAQSSKRAKISADRGVKDILFFFAQLFNKLIQMQKGWEDFEFSFTGVEVEDRKERVDIENQQAQYLMTINEIRALHDLKKLEHGDILLNPTYMQAVQQASMERQQQQFQQSPGEGQSGTEGEEGQPDMMGALGQMSEEEMDSAIEEGLEQIGKSKEGGDEFVVIEL